MPNVESHEGDGGGDDDDEEDDDGGLKGSSDCVL